MAIDNTEGAGTPIWEPVEYDVNEDPSMPYGNAHAARGPDNIVRRVWQDEDYALAISWTSNNGSTWSRTQIITSVWKGHTSLGVGGVVVLANNTTIVHFIADGADDAYNTYVAVRWNWEGDWDIIKVYGAAANGMAVPRMALNETKVLLTYCTGGNAIRYKIFDPSDSSVDPLVGSIPSLWIGVITGASNYDITVNQTGYFIICAQSWSGTEYRYYIRDLDLTHLVTYATVWSGTVSTDSVTIMSTSDDGFAVVASILWGGGGFYGWAVWHGHTPWVVDHYELITWAGAGFEIDVVGVGSCIDDDDRVWVYWANDTGSGGGVHISLAYAHYQADEPHWEANLTNAVYDYGTDDDVWYHADFYDGKYPVVGGYSVNIPDGGWMGGHSYMNEAGSPDEWAYAMYWNASFHWYESNQPPEFSSETPINTTTGVALQPWCHVTVEDPDGDDFNVTWYENSTGSWVQRQQNLTTSNGTFWWQFTQASSYSTTYYWKLVANDTNGNENMTIYHFTTLGNTPPVGSSPFPSNGSSGIIRIPTCRITVSDANGDPMDISWLENTTGSWVERHVDSGVSDGTFSFRFTQFSAYSTTYYWRINLTDGTDDVTYIFHFTTMDNQAPSVVFPSPGNGSTSSSSPTTSITVGDLDPMDVDWLEWTGVTWVLRQRSTSVSSGVYTWVFSGATEDDETYYWAVNATDGSLNTTKVYHFTVDTIAPTEDDEGWNLETLDYSMFIGLMFLIIVVMIAGLGAIVKYTRDV